MLIYNLPYFSEAGLFYINIRLHDYFYHQSQLRNKKLKDQDLSAKVKFKSNWFEKVLTRNSFLNMTETL